MIRGQTLCRVAILGGLVLQVDLGATARAERPGPAVFGLAIGYNRTTDSAREDLKYADDDAVNNFRLIKTLGGQAVLLTHLDGATKELHPSLRPGPPTHEGVRSAISALNRYITAARKGGVKTVLYLFVSGHGDVHHGEGYVQLQSGRLTRSTLIKMLEQSRADANHVIIDACKSYFLVFHRGPGGRRRPGSGAFLPAAARVPSNTGFLLSTSAAQDSHEWEAFQGGVFSHEVRSALRGAADLNADGLVTYEEAAAFIYTANKTVPNRRFRPRFYLRPPAGASARKVPLVDLRPVASRRIVFGPEMSQHFHVEDSVGTRLADLHPSRRPVALVVPPRGKLFVREANAAKEYVIPERPRVLLAALTPRSATSRARGAAHESFRRLFAHAFGEPALRAYRTRPAEVVGDDVPRSTLSRWLRPALGLLALAALATGGTFTALALHEQSSVSEQTSNLARQEANQLIKRNNVIAVTSYVLGGVAAAGYLVWRFWPTPKVKVEVSPAPSAGHPMQLRTT